MHESSKEKISFLDLSVYVMGTFIQISMLKLLIATNILNASSHPEHTKIDVTFN